jgi:Fic family protein
VATPLREHLEATNHAEAFDFLRQLVERAAPVDSETIHALHTLVLQTIDPTAGQYRTSPVYIRGSDVTPPPARLVPGLMVEWIRWLEGEGLTYHPIVRASIAHYGFVAVHPPIDGNGRTGRLLLNVLPLRDGYPPAFLLRSWAQRYRRTLSTANHGRYTSLVNLFGQAVEAVLEFYLEACAAVPDAYYQPLPDLARAHGRDPNYLVLLW